MAAPVTEEKVVYLLDPVGASRRSRALRLGRPAAAHAAACDREYGVELPYVPPFLHKHGGLVMSLGQFMQYVGSELMASGTVQIWPGTPVAEALIDDDGERVCGVRLCDQGVDRDGQSRSRLHARHGYSRRPDGGGRRAGGRGGPAARRGIRAAGRPSPARVGAWA